MSSGYMDKARLQFTSYIDSCFGVYGEEYTWKKLAVNIAPIA
jgi:hypothetical protein